MKCLLLWPSEITRSKPSSMATNSAHLMLRPFDLHPSRSLIASQCLSKTMPIPQSVDASTQNLVWEGGGGQDRVEPHVSLSNWFCHHRMSLSTASGGVFRVKLERAPANEAAKRDSEGSLDLPSGTASEQCTRVPRMASASFQVNLLPIVQGASLFRYLDFLLLGTWTVLVVRSHKKPRYVNDELNGLVLACFHGHPRSCAIESMVSML